MPGRKAGAGQPIRGKVGPGRQDEGRPRRRRGVLPIGSANTSNPRARGDPRMSRHKPLEAENAALIAALSAMNDAVAQELGARMQRCREARIRRRETPVVTLVDALRAGPQFKCKTVACWCCRTAHVKRKKAQAMAIFADAAAANAHCSYVTVNAATPCDGLDEVAAAHTKMVDDLDNLRDSLSRRDRRFARISMFAILEVGYDGTRWRPHWHIPLAHPRLDRQEIAEVFRKRFPGARRVQVKPFHSEVSVVENVENCVGYAFKFDHRGWSEYASARLFLWIRKRAALRSMCSVLRAKVRTCSPFDTLGRSDSKSLNNTFVEPMPVVI